MDGIFGIGPLELFFIAIIALIVLGPERLPSALREVARTIRRLRELTNEFTSQFGDELKALDEINPRKILSEMTDPTKPLPGEKTTSADPTASLAGENKALTPPKNTSPKAKATANAILSSKAATDAARATKAAKEAEAAKVATEKAAAEKTAAEKAAAEVTTTEVTTTQVTTTQVTTTAHADEEIAHNSILPPAESQTGLTGSETTVQSEQNVATNSDIALSGQSNTPELAEPENTHPENGNPENTNPQPNRVDERA